MRSRCWRTLQCIRVLASLSIASHTEDRLGTAQLSQPNIGGISLLNWQAGILQAYNCQCGPLAYPSALSTASDHSVVCAGAITATLGSLVLALQAYAKTCMAAAPRGSALTQQSMGPDAPGPTSTHFCMNLRSFVLCTYMVCKFSRMTCWGSMVPTILLSLSVSNCCVTGGKRSRNAGAPGFALHDAALAALYGILGAFGSEVIPVMRSSKTQLPFGTTADVVALLTRCSTYSE